MFTAQTLEPVSGTIHGKRNFADVIKLRVYDDDIILVYSGRSSAITRVLLRRTQEDHREGKPMRHCNSGGVVRPQTKGGL